MQEIINISIYLYNNLRVSIMINLQIIINLAERELLILSCHKNDSFDIFKKGPSREDISRISFPELTWTVLRLDSTH